MLEQRLEQKSLELCKEIIKEVEKNNKYVENFKFIEHEELRYSTISQLDDKENKNEFETSIIKQELNKLGYKVKLEFEEFEQKDEPFISGLRIVVEK